MSQPILNDSPENDQAAQIIQDVGMFIRAQSLGQSGSRTFGPRFGFLSAMADFSLICAFDAPALDELPDVVSDGSTVLIRASALRLAARQEQANPGHRGGPLALALAGLAIAASATLGFDELDPLGVAIAAFPQGAKDPDPSLAQTTVGSILPERLNALLAKDHPRAAKILAADAERSDAAREALCKFLSRHRALDPAQATPFEAIAQRYAKEALLSGAISEPPSHQPYQKDYEASSTPALSLAHKLLAKREVRQEAAALDASASPASQSRPGPRV
jgi:hypothetical protein